MPSLDGAEHPLISALQDAFGSLVEEEKVDIVTVEEDQEQDACEVQADDWTLFAEGWPIASAWIAIDDDVASPDQFRTTLERVLGPRDLQAMRDLNTALEGEFATVLSESGDELSIALGALIRADVS